jgi:hypothetical protein
MSSNERFSDTGSGGRSLRDRASEFVTRLRGRSGADDTSDNTGDSGGSGGTAAPRGAQRAVDSTPTGGSTGSGSDSGGGGAGTSAPPGVRRAVDSTPDEQAQNQRRDRTLEDATPGPSASDTSSEPPSQTQDGSGGALIEQAGRAIREFGTAGTRDLGDTPVENPLTGNRVETDLNRASRDINEEIDAFREFNRVVGGTVARGLYGTPQQDESDLTGASRDTSTDVLTGLTTGAATPISAVTDLPSALKEGAETAGFLASGSISDFPDRAGTVGAQGARLLRGTARSARRRPVEFLTGAAVETALGTAALRGAGRAAQTGRNLRTRASVDETVAFDDISSSRGAEGDLPQFETDTDAPASEAVREVRERATDSPDAVQRATGSDAVLYRSEADRLGADVEAGEGRYELPGLFTSPDASPLRLDIGSERSSGGFRLPRPSDFTGSTQRTSAFEVRDIDEIPGRGAESGRIPDAEGGTRPDPSTGGFRFLTGDADAGTAFVRATGDRTTELEAIFPPGSRFDRSDTLGVELPDGDVATLDVFRQADGDTRPSGDADIDTDVDTATSGDTLTIDDITDRYSGSGSQPEGTPVTPPVIPTSGGLGGSTEPGDTGSQSAGGSSPTGSTTPPSFSFTSPPSGDSGGDGSTSPPTAPPTSPPTAPPTSPPTAPPTSPPTAPPTSPPTSPPTTPPTTPPSTRPTTPPGIPSVPGLTPPGRPRLDLDLPDDEPDDRRRLRDALEIDDVFSSGFVSGEELLALETGDSED